MNKIAVDAMGGDNAPGPEVAGAIAAVREASLEIVLVGDAERLNAELRRLGAAKEANISVRHASQVVTMTDKPTQAYRKKRDSSMRVAMEMVKSGEAAAFVSAGNSGAVMSHAVFVLKRLPDVDRPAIVTTFPTPSGTLVLCDMGANVEVKPRMLAQFGILGACYDRIVHGHHRPRVGLLSNGHEASKGTKLTREAGALLEDASATEGVQFRYIGYVEGSELFEGDIDVVATDGFTGNVVLKLSEGLSDMVFRLVKRELEGSMRGRVGGALVRPAMRQLKKAIDYAETGGALLAGVRGVVTICHGRSDLTAIKNAIKATDGFVRAELTARLSEAITRQHQVWEGATDGDVA
jgi:glycerol-3-phosphate acyltransferase PlsX